MAVSEAESLFKFVKNEIYQFVIVRTLNVIMFNDGERIVNDRQKHINQNEIQNQSETNEKYWTKNTIGSLKIGPIENV